jgi:hypothetical protein
MTAIAPAQQAKVADFDGYPPPRWATRRNPTRKTYGPAVARLAQVLGLPLMGWQRLVADVALEVDADGRFVYRVVDVTVPRQSGKTWLFGVTMDHRALTLKRARVWYTMQSGKDAVDWLVNEHWPQLDSIADMLELRRASGSEHVKWLSSGGLIRPFPPQPDALHSKHTDLVVIDESWVFDLARGRAIDQAIVPTQATKANAQVWKVSTAGDDSSTWWLGSVEGGRADVEAGRQEGRAFFEWSCPDHLDPTQEASWPVYHPAYGRTIFAPAMYAALDEMGQEEFSRAYGNRWIHTAARVIPRTAWMAAAAPDQPMPPIGDCALSFDVALDRTDACIVAAWRDGGGMARLEVADYRPTSGWVPERLLQLRERLQPVAISYDAAGPALDVADRCTRLGLDLMPVKTKEYVAACAGLLEAFMGEAVSVRYRPNVALDAAAAAAVRRSLGDAWAWGRRQSTVSISPLTAATTALWAFDHAERVVLGEFRIF